MLLPGNVGLSKSTVQSSNFNESDEGFTGRKNGLSRIYAVESLSIGNTLSVPSFGPVLESDVQPCQALKMEQALEAWYISCLAPMRRLASKGSCAFQVPLPPLRMLPNTFRRPGSSQRSTEPPSTCGPSVNLASPGWRIRRRSKYDMGVWRLMGLVGLEVCHKERRNF